MMQHVLTRFRIRPNKVQKTKAFLRKLSKRQKEMKVVLKESGIALDCSFVEGNTLYIFKQLSSLNRLKLKIKTSTTPLFEEIRAWAEECLVSRRDIKGIATFYCQPR